MWRTNTLRSPTAAFLLFFFFSCASAIDFRYHRYNEMAQFLRNFTAKHSNLARIYSIGKSIQGRDLLVVELTTAKNECGVPNVKLIGNIHGNEAVGRELLLHFMEFIVDNYSTNSTISWYLNNTRLHILPSLNPDGFERASVGLCDWGQGRTNSNDSDLNRSFPDFFRKNRKASQPETVAVQQWMKDVPFILSASLHGGALVANYPYENVKEDAWDLAMRWFNETSSTSTNDEESFPSPMKFLRSAVPLPPVIPPSVSPDDDVFQHLASLYANRHPTMHLGHSCPNTPNQKGFEGGITNGAAWYMITGGMQDYNYAFHGCMEITLEISCCKYPKETELPHLWEENKMALLDYIMEAHKGVKGQIIDGLTKKPIPGATLKIVGRDMNFYSSKNGEFWRLLLPNQYTLAVTAEEYEARKINFRVTKPKEDSIPQVTSLVVELYPPGYTPIPPTDGTTEPNSKEIDTVNNPVPNKTVRTIHNLYQDQEDSIGEEGLTAAVIQNNSFLVTNTVTLTWLSIIAILLFK